MKGEVLQKSIYKCLIFLILLTLNFSGWTEAHAKSNSSSTRVVLCVKGIVSRFTLSGDKAKCPKGFKETVFHVDLKAKKKI